MFQEIQELTTKNFMSEIILTQVVILPGGELLARGFG
jgi:hypothetical protein